MMCPGFFYLLTSRNAWNLNKKRVLFVFSYLIITLILLLVTRVPCWSHKFKNFVALEKPLNFISTGVRTPCLQLYSKILQLVHMIPLKTKKTIKIHCVESKQLYFRCINTHALQQIIQHLLNTNIACMVTIYEQLFQNEIYRNDHRGTAMTSYAPENQSGFHIRRQYERTRLLLCYPKYNYLFHKYHKSAQKQSSACTKEMVLQ